MRVHQIALAVFVVALAFGCNAAETPAAAAAAQTSNPDARDFAGVWLPDGRRSGRTLRGANLPYTPEAKKAVDEYTANYLPIDATLDDINVSCVPEHFPYPMILIAQYPWEIVMGDEQITMLFEMFGDVRRIHMNDAAPPAERLFSTMGYSRGHWEGATLVVETTRVLTAGAGPFSGYPPASRQRRYIERIKLGVDDEGKKRLENEITVIDPAVYTRPVVQQMYYKWSPDIQVGEYLCQQDLWDQNVQGNPSSVPWRH